jgi:hypothetical protein
VLFLRWCAILVSLTLLGLIAAVDMTATELLDGPARAWKLDLGALSIMTLFTTTEAFLMVSSLLERPTPLHVSLIDVDEEEDA